MKKLTIIGWFHKIILSLSQTQLNLLVCFFLIIKTTFMTLQRKVWPNYLQPFPLFIIGKFPFALNTSTIANACSHSFPANFLSGNFLFPATERTVFHHSQHHCVPHFNSLIITPKLHRGSKRHWSKQKEKRVALGERRHTSGSGRVM